MHVDATTTGALPDAEALPFLVIGYGNPLREDDGVGRHVAHALCCRYPEWAPAVLSVHQLTPELAEAVSRVDTVVFVDASAEGVPGEVRCIRLGAEARQSGDTHVYSPQGLLTLAEVCFGHRPEAYVVTLTGSAFGFSENLSAAVQRAVPLVAALVAALAHEVTASRPEASPV